MYTIYKYKLSDDKEQKVIMPKYAHILDIKNVGGSFFIWAYVNTEAETESRTFRIYGTGWALPEEELFGSKYPEFRITKPINFYIKTIQDGLFIWHVFELLKPKQ